MMVTTFTESMMGIANIRGATVLAACLAIASCVHRSAAAAGDLPRSATITVHNQGRDRIQVYLVSEKQDWLIGRLEPLETARLPLPEFGFTATPQAVALAVVPGWTRNLQPGRDPNAALSIDEVTDDLPGEEWIYVNGQLQGPLRAQVRARY